VLHCPKERLDGESLIALFLFFLAAKPELVRLFVSCVSLVSLCILYSILDVATSEAVSPLEDAEVSTTGG